MSEILKHCLHSYKNTSIHKYVQSWNGNNCKHHSDSTLARKVISFDCFIQLAFNTIQFLGCIEYMRRRLYLPMFVLCHKSTE